MTFSLLTVAFIATVAGLCFAFGWTARRITSTKAEVELKRTVYEAKGAIPQLESSVRNREQRINTLQAEAQTLRDRLTQVESASAAKDTEIVKRDREIRLARSELQIVKDGSVGLELNPDLIDGEQAESATAAGSDPKLAADFKKLESRYDALKRGLIQREDKIAELEAQLQGGEGKPASRILEQELAEQQAAAELAQATLAARDATIRELQARIEQDITQREQLESLTKRRGDTNRTLKDNFAKLESELPKLTEQLKARADVIAERDARISALDGELTHVIAERGQRDTTIISLETKLAASENQIAQQTSNMLTQRQQLRDVEQKVDMLTREVAETTKALQTAQAALRERDATLVTRDSRQQSTDDKLREHGNTVATLQNALKDRDFRIEGLVADKAAVEARLAAALANASESANASLKAPSSEPDAAVEGREARPRDTGTIAALRKTLAVRDTEIAELNAAAAALKMQLVAANARAQAGEADDATAVPTLVAPAAGDPEAQTVEAQLAAMTQRAARGQRELNAAARELKTLRTHVAELETRCNSLDGLVRGKDATLAERARRIEDLQDQMLRIEARVDERNQQIENLKRMREEQPPPGSVPLRNNNNPIQYTTTPKPQ